MRFDRQFLSIIRISLYLQILQKWWYLKEKRLVFPGDKELFLYIHKYWVSQNTLKFDYLFLYTLYTLHIILKTFTRTSWASFIKLAVFASSSAFNFLEMKHVLVWLQ